MIRGHTLSRVTLTFCTMVHQTREIETQGHCGNGGGKNEEKKLWVGKADVQSTVDDGKAREKEEEDRWKRKREKANTTGSTQFTALPAGYTINRHS